MNPPEPVRISRRDALQWVVAAGAALGAAPGVGFAAETGARTAKPYGTDPVLNKTYRPGDLWPLTFAAAQRRTAVALCDLILPADEKSPSASAVGVPDFVDEWISAPYPIQRADRTVVLEGLAWLDGESQRRFSRDFAALDAAQQSAIADDICHKPRAKAGLEKAADFFALFRNLTTTGFYTTPVGMKDIGFVGNLPQVKFAGPPKAVLEKLGLA
ncbi:MAG: gluconate 2-dehydrogenase subunit 3 family protein [Verrucomicrobia bacterium]|nr:MAG: gluconate 2-dehydrogenase subunit 3 family protein [Verrucomicrobiota bacterium]